VKGGDTSNQEKTVLSRHRRSIVNVWTIIAVIAFYFAYNAYVQGQNSNALILGFVGALLTYIGIKGE